MLGVRRTDNSESRRDGLASLAEHYGLGYIPGELDDRLPGGILAQIFGDHHHTDERRFLGRFAHFWPFGEGAVRHARDLLHGSYSGIDWALFDCCHLGAAKGTLDSYGVVCARVSLALPAVHLSPENLLHRVGCTLGLHELTFEVEEFNRRYFIRAEDERTAYDLLHPQAIDYLLGLPARDWQICGCQIVLAHHGQYRLEDIPKLMGEIDGFVRLIPGYVQDDCGFVPDWQGPFS